MSLRGSAIYTVSTPGVCTSWLIKYFIKHIRSAYRNEIPTQPVFFLHSSMHALIVRLLLVKFRRLLPGASKPLKGCPCSIDTIKVYSSSFQMNNLLPTAKWTTSVPTLAVRRITQLLIKHIPLDNWYATATHFEVFIHISTHCRLVEILLSTSISFPGLSKPRCICSKLTIVRENKFLD